MGQPYTSAQHDIPCSSFLAADGTVCEPLPDFAHHREALVDLYRAMVLTRMFDAKAVALQRTGRLGTFACSLGQEAVAVGIGAAMRTDDVLLPSFREQGAQFIRGVRMVDLLLYWGGDERGSDFAGPREDFPICVPVGTHAPHAVGVAMAMRLRDEKRAAVCVLGDGAMSKGDVYEAMNLAGVWQLPVVFIVNNNEWAISVPRRRQTAAPTMAQKAIASGFRGEQVDGNDVIAVRHVIERALARARDDREPSLIEALTYRLSDHTTADDARRYRDDAEVSARWKKDPIPRLRDYLVDCGHWDKEHEDRLLANCNRLVEEAAEEYLSISPQPPEAMFDYLYAELPSALADQRAAMLAAVPDHQPEQNDD
jgi:2-oxoisovalerate dehydrogenase E1 component subunit alpha